MARLSALRRSSRKHGTAAAVLLALSPLVLNLGAALAQPHPAGPAPQHGQPQPGYLGVSLLDLDPETATRLHLKDTHGALIVTLDREAPAATSGLRPHDVILEANGQRIDNVDQLRHRLRDTGAGNSISLHISRDGAEQTLTVQLGDQAEVAQRAWEKHFSAQDAAGSSPSGPPAPPSDLIDSGGSTFVAPKGRLPGSSFLGAFRVSALYTGAQLDPLSAQLAEYFGVHDGAGLLVSSVNENSPASSAGLRAGDVILRVNNQAVVSRMDWIKQLHANRGKPIQLSIMRNRREQTMSLVAGKKS